jgi:hypothetical protein
MTGAGKSDGLFIEDDIQKYLLNEIPSATVSNATGHIEMVHYLLGMKTIIIAENDSDNNCGELLLERQSARTIFLKIPQTNCAFLIHLSLDLNSLKRRLLLTHALT